RRGRGTAEVSSSDPGNEEEQTRSDDKNPDCGPDAHATERSGDLPGLRRRPALGAIHVETHQRRYQGDEEKYQRHDERHVDRERGSGEDFQECQNDKIKIIAIRLLLIQLDELEKQHEVDCGWDEGTRNDRRVDNENDNVD